MSDAPASEGETIIYVASTASILAAFWRPLLRRMVANGWKVVAITPSGAPSWPLAEPGIEHHVLDIARPIGALWSHLRASARLHDVYRRLRPAIVHHFTANPVIYGSLSARAAGVPCVVNTLSGLGALATSRRWDAPLLRAWMLAGCGVAARIGNSRTIVQNSNDREQLVRLRIVPAGRMALIRGAGVDLERFRPVPEPEGEPTILLCARMLWSKGIDDLVAAARLLRQRHVRFRLVLVGPRDEGHRDAVPVAALERLGAEGIASWLGMRDDMPDVFAAANIVVLPTRYGEGIPGVLLEAAACGRAVVASDTPGCSEVVHHGRTGLLVPAGDVPALADALQRLLAEQSLRSEMGRQARELAVAEFGQERSIEAHLALYASMRNDSGARRAA